MSLLRSVARALVPRAARNWLRSPSASARWLWDEVRHRMGRDLDVEIRPGWRLRCHPAAWRTAYRWHVDDPEQAAELDAFLATVRSGMVLFDIGAHYGLFSLSVAHRGGPDGFAIAVEPSAHALEMLDRVARANRLETRITSVHAAAAVVSGTVEMVDVGIQASGYFVQPEPAHGPSERRTLLAVSVDDLCARFGRSPTHLKIDVEGAEDAVLRGSERTLSTARPLVFLELHVAMARASGLDPWAPLDRLEEHGYRASLCDGSLIQRQDLQERSVVRVVATPPATRSGMTTEAPAAPSATR